MSLRECRLCMGTTSNGAQCRRRTCKTARYCWQHLVKETGLIVKKSKIAKSGDGLYTSRPIKKNTNIAKYEGEILSQAEMDRRYPGDTLAAYVLEHPKGVFIDARSTQAGIARYANACDFPGNRRPCNALLGKNAYLRSARNIKAGEEILTGYGKDYWKHIPKTKRKKARSS